MKIDKHYENYNNYAKTAQKREVPKETVKVNKTENINVQISDATKRLAQSVNLAKDEGISERVETIKKAIISGNYKIDDKTIAKKIMDNIHIQKGEQLKWVKENSQSILKG